MFFTAEEKMHLLTRLPSLELSYEPKLHKKVYAPLYYVLPKGPKALLWYTYWKEQNVCLLVKLNERGNYSDVQVFTSVFTDSLALGTIIYGTYFLHYNRHYFTTEQLYYYKGSVVAKKTYNERLNLLLALFREHVEQVAYTASSLIVGMPVLTESYEDALEQMEKLPYKTYGIAAVHARQHVPCESASCEPASREPIQRQTIQVQAKQQQREPASREPASREPASREPASTQQHINTFCPKAIFKVKADLAADNYHLYTAEDTFYETAMVPTYKCSVLMNALFRNIKENANLDLLEESDDEDEFENTQIDKFVDLEKTVAMECVYSKRFKKWQPVKTVSVQAKIISLRDLLKK
jgi:hypothetical protein